MEVINCILENKLSCAGLTGLAPAVLPAPLPGPENAFHRALCLFCGRGTSLPSREPPSGAPPTDAGACLCPQLKSCRLRPVLGPRTRSRCHKTHYSSRERQALDWRLGHKQARPQSDNLDSTVPDHNCLFPEFEIVIQTGDKIIPVVAEK